MSVCRRVVNTYDSGLLLLIRLDNLTVSERTVALTPILP